MDHRALVLLGLLMAQRQHGYQLNDFIERNLSTMTNLKKPTAYATLDKLNREGYIEIQMEQEGNRPPRKVYSINDKGKHYFYSLLIENLSSAENIHFLGDIGLMFIEHLPLDQTVSSLHTRLNETIELLQMLKKTPSHGAGTGIDLAIAHKTMILETEVAFLEDTIAKLKSMNYK